LKIVKKISQQMAKLCQKLVASLFLGQGVFYISRN